jgi:hypothetical protein
MAAQRERRSLAGPHTLPGWQAAAPGGTSPERLKAMSLALAAARQSLDKLATEISKLPAQDGDDRGAGPRVKSRELSPLPLARFTASAELAAPPSQKAHASRRGQGHMRSIIEPERSAHPSRASPRPSPRTMDEISAVCNELAATTTIAIAPANPRLTPIAWTMPSAINSTRS